MRLTFYIKGWKIVCEKQQSGVRTSRLFIKLERNDTDEIESYNYIFGGGYFSTTTNEIFFKHENAFLRLSYHENELSREIENFKEVLNC